VHWVSVNDDKLHETWNKKLLLLLLLLSLGIIKVHPDASNNFLLGTFRLVDFKAALHVPNPAAYEMYIKAGFKETNYSAYRSASVIYETLEPLSIYKAHSN
jgi:hypothetical protein